MHVCMCMYGCIMYVMWKWENNVYIHEKIERKSEGVKASNEICNRIKRTEIECHNNNLRLRKFRYDSTSCFFCIFYATRRKNHSRTTRCQNTRRFCSDSRSTACDDGGDGAEIAAAFSDLLGG
jgi:hypothetical protein